jgi:hypothetical protein
MSALGTLACTVVALILSAPTLAIVPEQDFKVPPAVKTLTNARLLPVDFTAHVKTPW